MNTADNCNTTFRYIDDENVKDVSKWLNYRLDIGNNDFLEISVEIRNGNKYSIKPEYIQCHHNDGIYYTNTEFNLFYNNCCNRLEKTKHGIKYFIRKYYSNNLCDYNISFFNHDHTMECTGYYIISVLSYIIRDLKHQGYTRYY